MSFMDKLKMKIWRVIYKHFLALQNFLLKYKIIHHDVERQRYHIGWLAPGKNVEDLKLYLHTKWGFGNHFVAWKDSGQILSWRKLADFNDQYHLRVFEDGEIRGHFEYTPEGHPIDHLTEHGEKEAKEDFLKFLGDFVIQKKYVSNLVMDPNSFNPDSEVTIESKG